PLARSRRQPGHSGGPAVTMARPVAGGHDDYIEMIDRAISATLAETQLGQVTAEDDVLDGRTLRVRGRTVLQFGSCSYLGLELDERLKAGAIDALRRFGTVSSSSRAYMQTRQNEELEALLSQICGGAPVAATPTTTLAH